MKKEAKPFDGAIHKINLMTIVNELKDWKTVKMPFGKYKGIELRCIPIDYIQWGAENLSDDRLRIIFEHALSSMNPNKTRNKKSNKINFKDIYKLVDISSDKILFTGELEKLPVECNRFYPGFSMTYPNFIFSGGRLVAKIEFVRKEKKK